MAAPAVPISAWPGKGFYQLMIEGLTICSNLSIPTAYDATQTGVVSGTSASTIIAALIVQRDLL
jgi:hypothetical protein